MTSESGAEWRRAIESAARSVAGERWTDAAVAMWNEDAERPQTLVTIFGPFDAGKSTLLKRLLVEDGTPIPAWLTISARRDTFEVNDVASGQLVYRDTPGTGSGAQGKDAVADEALVLTDALLVVVPPSLTGAMQRVRDLVDGSFYGLSLAAFPRGALLLVVAQLDSAGANPVRDPEGYDRLRARKRRELEAMLHRPDSPSPPVYLVAADPFARVGPARLPRPGDYVAIGDRDGIAELREALGELEVRVPELRSASAARYWGWIGTRVLERAREELGRARAELSDLRRRLQEVDLLEQQLDSIDAAATAALDESVRAALRSLAQTRSADSVEGLRTEAEHGLDSLERAWRARWDADLKRLARDAGVELELRAGGSPAAAARRVADLPPAGHTARAPSVGSVSNLVKSLRPEAEQRLRHHYQWHEWPIGMPIEEQRKLLEWARSADPAQMTPAMRAAVERVARSVEGHEQWEKFLLPAAFKLGPVAIDLVVDYVGALLDARDRQRQRAAVEGAAAAICADIRTGGGQSEAHGWNGAVAALRNVLRGRWPAADEVAVLEEREAQLDATASSLVELLQEAPVD